MPIPTGDPPGNAVRVRSTVTAREVRRTDLVEWDGEFREVRDLFTTSGGKHIVFTDRTSCTVGDYVAVTIKRRVTVSRR